MLAQRPGNYRLDAGAQHLPTPIVEEPSGPGRGVIIPLKGFQITNPSASHETTGWNDYEFLFGTIDEPANDALANDNR